MTGESPVLEKKPITYNEFVVVVIKLLRTGKNLTYEAIIKGLGGRGSKSTIKKFKDEWQKSLKESDIDVLPPRLPRELIEPLEGFFNAAISIAEQDYTSHKKKCDERVDLAEFEMKESRAELSSLDSQLRDLETNEIRSSAVIEQLEREAAVNSSHYENSIEKFESTIRQLGIAATDSQKTNEDRIQKLIDSHALSLAALNEKYRTETRELKSLNSDMKTKCELLSVALNDERVRSTKENDHWLMEVDKARAATSAVEVRLAKDVARVRAELDVISAREDRGNIRNGDLEKRVDILNSNIIVMHSKLANSQEEILTLKATIQQLRKP